MAVAALSPALAQEDGRPDLVVAMEDLRAVFDPVDAWTGTTSSIRILYSVHDHLLDLDYAGDSSIIPGIATDWRRIDDTTLEFDIRDGVVFHDGTIMTVEDVAFSLGPERMLNEDAPGYEHKMEFVPSLAGVEIVDRDTAHPAMHKRRFRIEFLDNLHRAVAKGPYRPARHRRGGQAVPSASPPIARRRLGRDAARLFTLPRMTAPRLISALA